MFNLFTSVTSCISVPHSLILIHRQWNMAFNLSKICCELCREVEGIVLNGFWVFLMLISLRNTSVFLRLRYNHLWNSISCWSDSIQSNKTQASSTSPCGHSKTSFCASHTRLSHCRPCWLHSQSNITAVFFSQYPSLWDRWDHTLQFRGICGVSWY